MAKFVAGKHDLSKDVKTLQSSWGTWVVPKIQDVKNFHDELQQKSKKLIDKMVLLSSVTDSYQPIEAKLKLTQRVLEVWHKIKPKARLEILTRSALILRDIDLLSKITEQQSLQIGISISVLPQNIFRKLEPIAPTPNTRIDILKQLKQKGLESYAFIAPVWPGQFIQLRKIVTKLKEYNIRIRFVELLNKITRRKFNINFTQQEIDSIKDLNIEKIILH